MEKTKKNWLKRGLTMALACAMCLGLCNVNAFAVENVPEKDSKVVKLDIPVEDGVYLGKVEMYNASRTDQYSMGNAALRGSTSYSNNNPEDAHQSVVIVKDGKATALLEWMPMAFMGTYGFMMELDEVDTEYCTQYGLPDQNLSTLTEAQILTTHKTEDGKVVYDSYNNPESEYKFDGSDSTKHTRPAVYGREAELVNIVDEPYPWLVALDVTPVAVGETGGADPTDLPTDISNYTNENASFAHVFVPVMFDIMPSTGDQDSRVKVVWDSLTKIEDPEKNLQYQLYEALQAEQGNASNEAYADYQGAVAEVQEALSDRWPSQALTVTTEGSKTKIALNYKPVSDDESAELIGKLSQAREALEDAQQNWDGKWNGTTVSEPVIEAGTAKITDAAELAWVAQQVNNGTAEFDKISIENDIDLNNQEWTPIGNDVNNYTGSVEGNGHMISGLLVTKDTIVKKRGEIYKGLFGYMSGADAYVKNLTVAGKITGQALDTTDKTSKYVGGIVGYSEDVDFSNCISYVEINEVKPTNYLDIGGITGRAARAEFESCANHGKITAENIYQLDAAGGIVGVGYGLSINGCYNTADIVAGGKLGGIAGQLSYYESTGVTGTYHLTNCYNVGALTAAADTYPNVGGIAGSIGCDSKEDVTISGLYNCGDLSAQKGKTLDSVGGLFSNASVAAISNSYVACNITQASGRNGAVAQCGVQSDLTHVYALKGMIAKERMYGGGSLKTTETECAFKTAEELKDASILELLGDQFAADTKNINQGYPILQFQVTPEADYTAVDAALARAEALNKDDYKDFSGVEAAIAAVERGKGPEAQEEVDAMAQAINDAVDALELKNADYSAVDAALAKIPEDLSSYTDETVQAVNTAKNAVVRDKKITEQEAVDKMAQDIEDAIAALAYRPADYTAVNAAIEKANALDRTQYANYSAVEAALNAVVEGKNITEQEAVNKMAKDIEDAIAALEYNPADYEVVKQALAAIPEDLTGYTQETVDAVDAAKKAVDYTKNITEQEEVNAMAQAIQDAVNALVRIADYSAVDAAIAEIPEDLSLYTDETAQAVNEAVEAVVRGKGTPEQDTVNGYAQAIRDAVSKLTYRVADYTAVDEAIEKAEAIKDICKDYSKIQEAIDAVNRDKNITEQSKVDAMAQAIEDAIAAVEYNDADYTKVDEAIEKANALDKSKYKDFSGVENAINAVVRDKNVTEQAEVDAMAKAIEDAIAALEGKDTGISDGSAIGGSLSGGNGLAAGSGSGLAGSSGQKTAKTGDTANMMIWIAAALIAVAAVAVVAARRRKRAK